MKKIIGIMVILIGLVYFTAPDLLSRSQWEAPPGHIWSTPNGQDSQEGVPRAKATRTPSGNISIGGGCDTAPGICWELADGGTLLIVYDLVTAGGSGDDLIFIPVESGSGGGN